MKSTDIYSLFEAQQELIEVNMRPSNLVKLANAVPGAKVGIEYEMQIPGIFDNSSAGRTGDERAYDIDDICNFFDNHGINDIDRLRDSLYNNFYDWQADKLLDFWSSNGREYFATYCRENATDEEVLEYLGKSTEPEDEDDDEVTASRTDWNDFIETQWDNQDGLYDDARQEFEEDHREDFYDERSFLNDNGIEMMSDVADSGYYSVTWPGEGNESAQELALDFMEYMGLDSVAYLNEDEDNYYYYEDGYWENTREKPYHLYIFEPDVSLAYNGPELVGPTQSLDQTLEDSLRIRKWAKSKNATSSERTGLHMNVSIPDFSSDKLDYVKLALLLGDQYILDQFDRYGSYYAKSALDIVKERAQDKDTAARLLNQLKSNMNQIASKIIHSGYTEKFTSINTKDNRVEFRSPGGDWLNGKFDKYENALRRFIVALDAACDPTKYKKEYDTKLHTILTGDKTVKYYDPKDPENRLDGPNGPGTGAVNPVPKKFITINDFEGEGNSAAAELRDQRRKYNEYLKVNRKNLRTYINNDKALATFSKLMSGEITTKEYIRELEKTRKERLKGSGIGIIHPEQAEEGDWVVTYDDGTTEESIYIANNAAVPTDNEAFKAAKKFKPQWFKPNTVEYITIKPFAFDQELDDLRLYRADYGNKSMGVVARNEDEAKQYIRIMDPEYFSDNPNTDISLHDEDEVSKRKIYTMLNWQNDKIDQGKKWLVTPKIWLATGRTDNESMRELIAAVNRDEAIDIAMQINPEIVNSDNFRLYINDSLPGQERYDYFRASNQRDIDLRNERVGMQNQEIDISNLKMYRITSTELNSTYMYVVAENGGEAAEIASKIDPNKFGHIPSLTVQEQHGGTFSPSVIKNRYLYQQEQLSRLSQSADVNIPQEFNQPIRVSDMRSYRVINDTTGQIRWIAGTSAIDAINRAKEAYPEFADGNLRANVLD